MLSREPFYFICLCPLACALCRRSSCFSFLTFTFSLTSASIFLNGLNMEFPFLKHHN